MSRVYGRNLFEAVHGEAFLVKLGKRVLNPLVALLIAAVAVSGISGDYGSFFIIVAVLALSMTLDIVQEYRAEREAEALRHSVAVHADVMRDRKQVEQPHAWDIAGILRFTTVIGIVSFVFDAAAFLILLKASGPMLRNSRLHGFRSRSQPIYW